MAAKRVAAVTSSAIGTTIVVVKAARLPSNWVEIKVGTSGVVGGSVVEVPGGQSASGEDLSSHCGGPATLPVCGGSDRVSAQEKRNTEYW